MINVRMIVHDTVLVTSGCFIPTGVPIVTVDCTLKQYNFLLPNRHNIIIEINDKKYCVNSEMIFYRNTEKLEICVTEINDKAIQSKIKQIKEPIGGAMKFEIGKFYKHSTGTQLSIICEVETTLRGKGLLAETNTREELTLVGTSEENAINYTEITKEEWMKNFSDEI